MNNKHIAVTVVSGTKTMTPANYDTALNQLVIYRMCASHIEEGTCHFVAREGDRKSVV